MRDCGKGRKGMEVSVLPGRPDEERDTARTPRTEVNISSKIKEGYFEFLSHPFFSPRSKLASFI